jgi:hypothetical protein
MTVSRAQICANLPPQQFSNYLRFKTAKDRLASVEGCSPDHATTKPLKFIRERKLRAFARSRDNDSRGRPRTCPELFVSGRDLARLIVTPTPPAEDMQFRGPIAVALGMNPKLVDKWAKMKSHPALGRKVNQRVGPSGVREISKADIETCLRAFRNPIHFEFPGNPGVWIAEGVFRHYDRRIFHTDRYVCDRGLFGIAIRGVLSLTCYRKILNPLQVAWHQPEKQRGKWTTTVYSEDSLKKYAGWRKGKTKDGSWLVENKVWLDSEGRWHSTPHVAELTNSSLSKICNWMIRDKFSKHKKCPMIRPSGEFGGAKTVTVIHEDEVERLLRKAKKSGRSIDSGNERLYERCYELYCLVRAKKMETVTAVHKILKEFGETALGETKDGKPSSYDVQRTAFKRNAQIWQNSLEK